MITANTCPICQQEVLSAEQRCSHCQALVQLELQRPQFNRQVLNEALVQAAVEQARKVLYQNPGDGNAHYTLGLAYLNMGLNEQGIQSLQQAARLLPEKHMVRYELALCEYMAGNLSAACAAIEQALELAPEQQRYQYLECYLDGALAFQTQGFAGAVADWIEAYQIFPDAQLARPTLERFIAQHEAKLQQPIARTLPGLPSEQVEALRVLRTPANTGSVKVPHVPGRPRDPGKWSMALLRRVAASRALAIEQIHVEQLARYEQTRAKAEQRRGEVETQNQAVSAQLQQQVADIRGDLPLMARLCAAVAEADARAAAEQQRREEQRQREAEQRRAAQMRQQAQAVAAPAAPVREQRYHATRAKYLLGLPVGKSKDWVDLIITNQRIVFKNAAMIGGWEYTLPLHSLVEATEDVEKHAFSTEKRLRISYHDQHGMTAHVILSDVKVAECVQKILRARANA